MGKLKTFTDSLSGTTAFAVSSSNTAIGVTVNDQSKAKTFDAKLAVSSLASAQTLEFAGFSSKNAAINLGNISVDFGTWSGNSFTVNTAKTAQSIAVTNSNNSLTSLAESLTAIEGVNATVTDKGDGTFSLIVNSDTEPKMLSG